MDSKIQLPKLLGQQNYQIWAIRMESYLQEKDLGDYIQKDLLDQIATSTQEPSANLRFLAGGRKSLSLIRLALADGPLLQVRHVNSALETWLLLERLYAPKGFSAEFLSCKQLFETTLASSDSIEEYLNQIKRLSDDLSSKNLVIPPKLILAWTLNNLTNEYDHFIAMATQTIRASSQQLDLEGIFADLLDESRRLQNRDSAEALAVRTKTPQNQKSQQKRPNSRPNQAVICAHCKKPGHKIDSCWIKHPSKRPQKSSKSGPSGGDSRGKTPKSDAESEDVFSVFTESSKITELGNLPISEINPKTNGVLGHQQQQQFDTAMITSNHDKWVLDSGATRHICCDIAYFDAINPCNTTIQWGNKNHKIQAKGVGSVRCILPN